MKRLLPTALFPLLAVACSGSSEDRGKPEKEKSEKGGPAVVRIGKIRSEAPGDWKVMPSKSSMRAYTFRLAGTGGAGDAEMVVFRGIGGSAKANVERWQKQFTPPEGKKREDASKVTEIKVGGYPALYLDAEGTYNSGMAFGPKGPQKDYRMLGVCIEIPDNPSQIILRGPARTVAKHKKEFDDWLKAFK